MAMPGKSFSGPLPPLTAAEVTLRDRLSRPVRALASDIGERNIWTYDALSRSADYLAAEFRALGYETRDQTYDCRGKTVRNIDVELPGSTKPEEILVVGGHYDSVH